MGTPLLTPTGDKLIEDFKPGDWILTAPEDDPEAPLEAKQVEEVFRDVSRLLNLRVEGRTIQTTPEHPFYARGRGWIVAQELQPGDLLRSHDCKWVPVEAVEPGAEERRCTTCAWRITIRILREAASGVSRSGAQRLLPADTPSPGGGRASHRNKQELDFRPTRRPMVSDIRQDLSKSRHDFGGCCE